MNENTAERILDTVTADTEETGIAVRRRDMSELSEYFERDSRRYDNGFELP